MADVTARMKAYMAAAIGDTPTQKARQTGAEVASDIWEPIVRQLRDALMRVSDLRAFAVEEAIDLANEALGEKS